MDSLKIAHFTVSASMEQSARWKQAAEMAGHVSIAVWLAEAADRHMQPQPRAGSPVALSPSPVALNWRRGGRFPVVLEGGEETEVTGAVSPPFGIYYGRSGGPVDVGYKSYTLVYLPERRILATFRYSDKARALASELAPTLLHGLPPPDPGGVLDRVGAVAS